MGVEKHVLLIVGIVLFVVGIGILAYSDKKMSECESLTGKVVQFLDSSKRDACAGMETLRTVSMFVISLGVFLTAVYFVNRKKG